MGGSGSRLKGRRSWTAFAQVVHLPEERMEAADTGP